ncbi:phosphonopyruvate decarboxylase [Nocardiopsis sp. FIRDI 009]|uniref:phosphonopyruvate decarboxylase n=1 Tax=Nocardiopsis sp. FIRDI 009 TaxID=714197 RepID=UPI000E269344|nr:phosphonopyruvate decarboxylase [Nocardiopsis sp. FIRDI 009]
MISAEFFCAELERRGFGFASGVPCSYFGGPISLLSRAPGRYVAAANEGGALATAAGAALAGERAYVMLQNSGLGNLVNPLTSLVMTYRIPVLTFVSLRGWPDPAGDEPQHAVMGPTTAPYLDLLGLPHWTLRADADETRFREVLDGATTALDEGHAPFVLVEKHTVGAAEPAPEAARGDADTGRMDSADAIRLITKLIGAAPVIATTGYTGRELFGAEDRPANFYMQGSMGHASSIALGVALRRPDRPVIALDGDGAALMHLGALSAIGAQAPTNLVHVVLDNGIHESTGGQGTTSDTTRLEQVASAAGYPDARRCATPEQLQAGVASALSSPGPHMLVVPTRPRRGPMPPRATGAHPPEAMRDRFAAAVRGPFSGAADD